MTCPAPSLPSLNSNGVPRSWDESNVEPSGRVPVYIHPVSLVTTTTNEQQTYIVHAQHVAILGARSIVFGRNERLGFDRRHRVRTRQRVGCLWLGYDSCMANSKRRGAESSAAEERHYLLAEDFDWRLKSEWWWLQRDRGSKTRGSKGSLWLCFACLIWELHAWSFLGWRARRDILDSLCLWYFALSCL
jgi:hypothetical protein